MIQPLGLLAFLVSAPTNGWTVAALHDAGRLEVRSDDCADSHRQCALVDVIHEAANRGARLLVLPEYALHLEEPAPPTTVGAPPPPGHVLAPLAAAAGARDITVIVALWRRDRDGHHRNSQVVLGSDETVRAVHDKVELFSEERAWATPGDDLSVVEVDGIRVGLLICADLYAAPALHAELVHAKKAQLVAVSAQWTATGAERWPATFAHDWQVPVVFANAGTGDGLGSGAFLAGGAAVHVTRSRAPELFLVELPISPPSAPSVPRPTPAGSAH